MVGSCMISYPPNFFFLKNIFFFNLEIREKISKQLVLREEGTHKAT